MRTAPIALLTALAVLATGCSEPTGTDNANPSASAQSQQPAAAPAAAPQRPAGVTPSRVPFEALEKPLQPSTACNLEYVGDTLLGSEPLQTANRNLVLTGWLGSDSGTVEQPVLRFETADDKSAVWAVPLTLGGKRDDVVASTGNTAHANSGFRVQVDTSSLPAGRYHLYLAHGAGGAVHGCDNGRYVEFTAG